MNKKSNFISVLIVLFTVMGLVVLTSCNEKAEAQSENNSQKNIVSDTLKRDINGEYLIGSDVKIYDGDLMPMDAFFTYTPSKPENLNMNNAVILNWLPTAFFFGGNNEIGSGTLGLFRYCIDKSIEWAATAKENDVHSLSKIILPDDFKENDGIAAYMLKNSPNSAEPIYLIFHFFIGDLNEDGKEETLLVLNWKKHDELRYGSPGNFLLFKENDFARLKEIFSESYLAKINKQEEEWQKSRTEQEALFE